jgi:predicted nucleic acid-binding protein
MFMIGMRFVDTNVLLYRISQDPAESQKAEVATQILGCEDLSLSVQVLQEFYVQATRHSRVDPLSHEDALDLITSWKRFPVQETTVELLDRALTAKARWQISYWDAAIIEAARLMGCRELLSEDLSDGQDYEGVKVVNPFALG